MPPNEPESKPPAKRKAPRPIPVNDGFVVFEVDGFAQMTPEQKLYPVISMRPTQPKSDEPPKE